jgi:hypothetical protein|tara:strand:+ start:105 stop:578 length:474 start_codon:yes stop_codon:yes gene_type:complete
MTTPKEEDIVHLLSSDEELIPIPMRACQFSTFLSVALRRREDFGGFVSGKHQREEEKDFIVLRVPNVSSKTLSIIVEYLNHRDSIQERKEMKLKRRLRRREDGFTSSSSSNNSDDDSSFCSKADDEFVGKKGKGEQRFHVPAEEAMNVMMASNFLGC